MFLLNIYCCNIPMLRYVVIFLSVGILLRIQTVGCLEAEEPDVFITENVTYAPTDLNQTTASDPSEFLNDDLDDESRHFYSSLNHTFIGSQKQYLGNRSQDKETKTVLFFGNSGSGKTTLVQLLAGDVSDLQAHEIEKGSGSLMIHGGPNINHGIYSSSLYPDVVMDNETGILLVDNPGFYQSGDPSHEIAVALNMKNFAESSDCTKIAIVCRYSILQKGMYRSEFTGVLERIVDMVEDIGKHSIGISLIATKVKNSYLMTGQKVTLVPDSVVVEQIANFLQEAKKSYSAKISNDDDDNESGRSRKILRILQRLLQRKSGEYQKINIFREPQEAGPLLNQEQIMLEREKIRDTLLNDEGFSPVRKGDFRVTVSVASRERVDNLFRKLDKYIVDQTKKFGEFLSENFEENMKKVKENIESIKSQRKEDVDMIKSLADKIEGCHNPGDYVTVVGDFIKNKSLNYSRSFLEHISKRSEILENVSHLSMRNHFSPTNWRNGLSEALEKVQDALLYQVMLQETFLKLRDYEIQRKVFTFDENVESIGGMQSTTVTPINILSKLNLYQYTNLEFNNERVEEFNEIVINPFKIKNRRISCERDTLIVIDKIMFLGDVPSLLEDCKFVDSVIVLAADSIYINRDLNEELEGRNLMIISPQWVVQGERKIVLNGKDFGKQPKANPGEIGMNGKNGNPGGNFLGIGLNFEGMMGLTVQACGGRGEDGQDGGDGRDGEDGRDFAKPKEGGDVVNNGFLHVYRKKISTVQLLGTSGEVGQDSGAGGQGGQGGAKGSVKIVDLDQPFDNLPLEYTLDECNGQPGLPGADGKPGKGGRKGCTKSDVTKTHEIFHIDILTETETHQSSSCDQENANGVVNRHPIKLNSYVPKKRKPLPPYCSMFNRLAMFIADTQYDNKITTRSVTEFNTAVRKTLCPLKSNPLHF